MNIFGTILSVKRMFLFSVLLGSLFLSFAQKRDLTFGHLTPDDGLSQISVNSIYIDGNGFVWIGTREGLNRYNGNDIQTFKLQKNVPHSLFCNNVLRIEGDGEKRIFLHCTEGIAEFELDTQRFNTLLEDNISTIYFNKSLYIAKQHEIFRFDELTRRFDLFYRFDEGIEVTAMCLDRNEMWWIGTAAGLYTLDGGRALRQVSGKGRVISIYEDSYGEKWVGTWEDGLWRMKRDGRLVVYTCQPHIPYSISSDFARCCVEDELGNIWVGTFNGLNMYSRKQDEFYHYAPNKNRIGSLNHSSVWCIVKDAQGTIWMGTYFGGVNYFNPEYEIFRHFDQEDTEGKGLSSPVVGRMLEDGTGRLWIATEGDGVNVYDRKHNNFKWIRPGKTGNSLRGNNVKAIYYDKEHKKMWIGTYLDGLNCLDLKTNRFTHYTSVSDDPATLPSNSLRDIVGYKGQLIIATQNGVCLFNPESGKCTRLFADKNEGKSIKMVASLLIDRNGLLWMAVTGEGVFSYDFKTDLLKRYRNMPDDPNSISNNTINSITEDSQGNLWFATSGTGMDRYLPQTDNFENFDSGRFGLASDCVYEIVESSIPGRMLLSTNKGFSSFDVDTHKFRNYGRENGFPLATSNENALYITKDGQVFIGGIAGMIAFYEKDLDFPHKRYDVHFTRLLVNGSEILPGDATGILNNSISYAPDITLKSNQSMFTLEFATSNFIPANTGEILYKLEGFSDRWNVARKDHAITYTNLNSGNYTLVVVAVGDNGEHIGQAKLNITVLPPYYLTIWAFLVYAILLSALLWYVIVTYKARIRLSESLKYEKKHLRDLKELNNSKLTFFTNISHEFRTPLTLIVGQVETLLQLQSFTPAIYNRILGIYKSSLQLKELISELLDFRKQEQGLMTIKAAPHNIVAFLKENYLLFLEYSNGKNITLTFDKEIDNLEVWYDAKQMQKVINNLLSNALKFTPENGTIRMGIRQEGNCAVIEVTDSGKGLKPGEEEKIFENYFQIERMNTLSVDVGTGIGLSLTKGIVELHHGVISVESEDGKGCHFVIKLLLGKAHFQPEQLAPSGEEEQSTETQVYNVEQIPEIEWEELAPAKILSDAKMLIVEDNESVKQLLVNIFSTFYHVETASDGVEALEKLESFMPHIVVCDVMMPRMSGIDLCKVIKGNPDTCHIPVVLLTARTATKHIVDGLKIGADDYITKPFNVNILVSRCNNLVNSRLILQERFSKQPQSFPQMLATNPMDKEVLDRAIGIIETHLDDTMFNVNIFASEMGVARTNLFTKLKAITGQTPNDFIQTIRLKKGALMLRNSPELNVTEIADRVGFSSARYFGKCFKEAFNVSPLAYRKGEGYAEEDDEETDNDDEREDDKGEV